MRHCTPSLNFQDYIFCAKNSIFPFTFLCHAVREILFLPPRKISVKFLMKVLTRMAHIIFVDVCKTSRRIFRVYTPRKMRFKRDLHLLIKMIIIVYLKPCYSQVKERKIINLTRRQSNKSPKSIAG
jgi:hypothetical protein